MNTPTLPAQPNILLMLVDQLRFPAYMKGDGGFLDAIKEILAFTGDIESNPYKDIFPGFCKLREFGVVFTDHTIAESACIPSRASLMTGQYGPRTGVTQTDGLFKSGDAGAFPWLPPNGTPTMGDWFKAAGYTSHYFGKWHISNPPEHTLRQYGFDDWELSWPEPHGSLINNVGTFRDYQFADLACSFLRNRGLAVPYNRSTSQQDLDDPRDVEAPPNTPFFAVCSFTNPHDIAVYPALCRGLQPETWNSDTKEWVKDPTVVKDGSKAVPIPPKGSVSRAPKGGTMRVPLNPNGLEQDCATPSPSQNEQLLQNNKPLSHYDNAYKVGLGLSAKVGLSAAQGVAQAVTAKDPSHQATPQQIAEHALNATLEAGAPFAIQENTSAAALAFLQYYVYMISMVDRHILQVLEALDQSGLRESTLLVFAADHGEMGAAHGMMMEKWHTAYQEVLHVPVVFSHPALNASTDTARMINAQTSHIDLLPTLLGFIGTSDDKETWRRALSLDHLAAPLPGVDVSGIVKGTANSITLPDGKVRQGVLFVTDDMITEPLPLDADPHNVHSWAQFGIFREAVEVLRGQKASDNRTYGIAPNLHPGSVCQPAHVRALRSGSWKLVRNCDPWSAKPMADQWELYNLSVDPYEMTNLVVYNQPYPTFINGAASKVGLDDGALKTTATQLLDELKRQEAAYLSPYPAAHPTAGATIGR